MAEHVLAKDGARFRLPLAAPHKRKLMKIITRGAVGGFIFGLLFALAHIFLNIRYDIPLYLVMLFMDSVIQCQGRSCKLFLGLAIIISALIWAGIGLLVARFTREENQSPSGMAE